jgi:hypothetical protein
MVLGCEDGTLVLLALGAQSIVERKRVHVEHSEPLRIVWHGGGAMFFVFFAKGSMCVFDCALQRLSLVGEKGQSITSFSFAEYMTATSARVTLAEWGPPSAEHLPGAHQIDPNTLCVMFEHGPLVVLRLNLGLRSLGDAVENVDNVTARDGTEQAGQLRPRDLLGQRLRNREWAEARELVAEVGDGAEGGVCLLLLLNSLIRAPGQEQVLLDVFRDVWSLYSSPSHPFHTRVLGLYTRLFRQTLAKLQFEVSNTYDLAYPHTIYEPFLSQEATSIAKHIDSPACFAELKAWTVQPK